MMYPKPCKELQKAAAQILIVTHQKSWIPLLVLAVHSQVLASNIGKLTEDQTQPISTVYWNAPIQNQEKLLIRLCCPLPAFGKQTAAGHGDRCRAVSFCFLALVLFSKMILARLSHVTKISCKRPLRCVIQPTSQTLPPPIEAVSCLPETHFRRGCSNHPQRNLRTSDGRCCLVLTQVRTLPPRRTNDGLHVYEGVCPAITLRRVQPSSFIAIWVHRFLEPVPSLEFKLETTIKPAILEEIHVDPFATLDPCQAASAPAGSRGHAKAAAPGCCLAPGPQTAPFP